MRRVTILLTGAILLILSFSVFAQDLKKESLVTDGLYVRETIPQLTPVPYPFLREADMMWTKRIWRMIDLREKINHPLYYPTTRMQDRISFVQRLVDAIKYNEISAYDPIPDDEFTTLLPYDQVIKNFGAEDETKTTFNPITERDTTYTVKGEIDWSEVKELMVKEEWFFDKQHSTMHVRIIGICPIRVYYQELRTGGEEEASGQLTRTKLFWIYFPEARKVLANTACFNEYNDAQRITFDHLFFKRRYSSYIIRESNVHNDRAINLYTYGGIPNMQESERIKNEMFTFEHDLWEY
ncbi:MAG: gliding motility protein GldN [Tenuifilaceae bacterium]